MLASGAMPPRDRTDGRRRIGGRKRKGIGRRQPWAAPQPANLRDTKNSTTDPPHNRSANRSATHATDPPRTCAGRLGTFRKARACRNPETRRRNSARTTHDAYLTCLATRGLRTSSLKPESRKASKLQFGSRTTRRSIRSRRSRSSERKECLAYSNSGWPRPR